MPNQFFRETHANLAVSTADFPKAVYASLKKKRF
jgi:hypothetical protein